MMKPPLTMLGKTSTATALSPSAFAPGVFLYSVLSDWVASRSICPAPAASAGPKFLLVECILIVCSRFCLLGQGHVRRDLVAQQDAVFVFDLQVARGLLGRHGLQHLRREGAPAIAL